MTIRTDYEPDILPGTAPDFIGPGCSLLKDTYDPTTAEGTTKTATTTKTIKFLKNCGDCEAGGWGSTYGFSPR